MTYNKILGICRSLRRKFEQDEARFFLGLVGIEAEHMDIIVNGGHDSFAQYLRRNELCDATRYLSFKAGLRHLEESEKALELGAPAVMALASIRQTGNVPKYEEAVMAWARERGGIVPSRQTAAKILRQVDPREEIPKDMKTVSLVAKLRAENQRLRAELAAAEKKIRDLEKALDKTRKRAG